MDKRSSKKQQELLEYIDTFIKEHGYGPSYREVMRGLGYKSVSTVAVHVDGLLQKGYIRKKDRSARSIEVVTKGEPQAVSVAEPTVSVTDHHTWLQKTLRERIADETLTDEEAAVLIMAAKLLGVADIAEIEAASDRRHTAKA